MTATRIFAWRWLIGRPVVACLAIALCSLMAGGRAIAQAAGEPASGAVTSGVTSGVNPVQTTAPATAAPTSQLQNQAMLYPGEDFLLGPGDLITVRVFGSFDYNVTVRVGLDGTVELPYIGSISLQGDSVRKAQTKIEDRLRTGGFFMNPDVIIQVLDTVNGSVTITGEVHTTVPVTTERSLRDVLLAAGGLPANASHTVKIVRPVPGQPGQTQVISVELGADLAASETANIPVHPHDIIQITRASVVYVLGAFKQQGSVPLDQSMPLTLIRLAALSGGVNFEGKYEDLRLIRTVDSKPMVVQVDIKKVLNGKAPDPILQADDIVFLPTNNMKGILKNLGVGGVIGIVTLLYAAHNF